MKELKELTEKIQLVAKYNTGEWFLEHYWSLDYFGLKQNYMRIYRIKDDGIKEIYPFQAPIRISKFDKETVFDGDDISAYETFEYAEMLRKQIENVKQLAF
ncbi:hypothetical protein M0R04_10060 [Candidatus Dojkabacteria bacterium]|jgi:hypothetical protein|nr:hypothetical protein [Candidatus Dojkabacteria bacterium]